MNSDGDSTPIPLGANERAALRPGIDANALSQLFLLIDPEAREIVLSLVAQQTPSDEQLVESGRRSANRVEADGPRAIWIEFPDAERNRLWRRVFGLPAV